MMRLPDKKIHLNNSAVIFIIISLWYALTNFLWWHFNTPFIPFYDSSAVHFLDIFRKVKENPPLIAWIMKGAFFIFGTDRSDLTIIAVNYLFFLIPLYFVYKTGKELDSVRTGRIAMMIFAIIPAVYGLSRQYGHKDYHIMAAVAVNVYCLIKSDFFKNGKWSLLYGLSAAAGVLIKEQFLAYFLTPFIWAAVNALRSKNRTIKLKNMILAVSAAVLTSGAAHYFKPASVKKIFSDPSVQSVPLFTFENVRIMIFGLYDQLLSPPVFLVFSAGVWYFVKKYKNEYKNMLLLLVLVPWILIFLMPHYKVAEYFTGFIPAVVIVCAVFINHVPKKHLRNFIIIFLAAAGTAQYVNFSFFPSEFLSRLRINVAGQKFYYYNANTKNIMNYNIKSKSDRVNRVVKLINKICPSSKFCVYVNEKATINSNVLRTSMILNDMNCTPRNGVERFVLKYKQDTIIIAGELPVAIKKERKIIDRDFYLAATLFYFEGRSDIRNKIRIFKRKNMTENKEAGNVS